MKISFRPAGLAVLSLVALVSLPAVAQSDAVHVNENGQTCFNGYGYTLKGGKYRYTEHHVVTRENGKITNWNVTFVGRNGQVIARKHMNFSLSQTIPVYKLVMPKSGYEEGIRHQDGTWTMFKRDSRNAKMQTKTFAIDQPMAANSGFNQLVQEHFKALENGKTVKFKFAAAGRQSVIDLEASKTGNPTFQGQPAVEFTAKLNMFLVNMFVQSLKLTYDPQTERLLQYEGIGNMHNAKGKVYPVRVSYYKQMPKVAKQHGAPAASCGAMQNG